MHKNLITVLNNDYQDDIIRGKELAKAERMIIDYFATLRDKLSDVIKYSQGSVNVSVEDSSIAEIKVKSLFLRFERREKCIKIFSSWNKVKNDFDDAEEDEYIESIIPYTEGCKLGTYEFNEIELENLIDKVFKEVLKKNS